MVNWTLVENELNNYFGPGKYGIDSERGARRVVDAYDLAVRGGSTIYGQLPINPNKELLVQAFISTFHLNGLTFNSNGLPPYQVLAQGFFSYWMGCQMLPFPPTPPCILPQPIPISNIIVFGGDVNNLALNLKSSLEDMAIGKTTSSSAKLFTIACRLHLQTITGLYFGMIPTILGPIPIPPIPWVGII